MGTRSGLTLSLIHILDSRDANVPATPEMIKIRHRLIHDVTQRLESFSLNTVISAFMEYNNKLIDLSKKTGGIDRETIEAFTKLLAPFVPHVAEEIWEQYGHTAVSYTHLDVYKRQSEHSGN